MAQGYLTHRSTDASLPPQLCLLMSQLYPIGKLSGQDLFAGIEIPSKMHSREFDPILFCCIGRGEFEGKCVCAKIPGYRRLVGSRSVSGFPERFHSQC